METFGKVCAFLLTQTTDKTNWVGLDVVLSIVHKIMFHFEYIDYAKVLFTINILKPITC